MSQAQRDAAALAAFGASPAWADHFRGYTLRAIGASIPGFAAMSVEDRVKALAVTPQRLAASRLDAAATRREMETLDEALERGILEWMGRNLSKVETIFRAEIEHAKRERIVQQNQLEAVRGDLDAKRRAVAEKEAEISSLQVEIGRLEKAIEATKAETASAGRAREHERLLESFAKARGCIYGAPALAAPDGS